MMRFLSHSSLYAFASLATLSAEVRAAERVRATVSADVVSPGETFVVTVESGEAQRAEDLGLEADPKATLLRSSSGARSFSFSYGPNGAQQSTSYSLQSYFRAPKSSAPLSFTPTVKIGGHVVRGTKMTVRVDEDAAKQRARARDPFDDLFGGPTDPFGPNFDPFRDLNPKFGRQPQSLDDFLDREFGPARAPEFEMPAPRAPHAFLHVVADKTQLVVGESAVIRAYVYVAEGVQLRHYQPRVPVAPDFEQHMIPTRGSISPLAQVTIRGIRYTVSEVGSYLVVPLKTGVLKVDGTSAVLDTYPKGALDRSGEQLSFDVREPDPNGRPNGYRLGDVGDFKVDASVAPRDIEQGGSVTVEITATGDGNFPSPWIFPTKDGVSWSEGQVSDQINFAGDGSRKGTRLIRYLATVTKPGEIDLGGVSWSSYDTVKRAYVELPIQLGTVRVKPSFVNPTAATPDTAQPPIPAAEARNVHYPTASSLPLDTPVRWLLGLPLVGAVVHWLRRPKRAVKQAPETIEQSLARIEAETGEQAAPEGLRALESLLVRAERERGGLSTDLAAVRASIDADLYAGGTPQHSDFVARAKAFRAAWQGSKS